MADFEPLGEELRHEGPVVKVYEGRFRAPDGSEIIREVIRHPGAVLVVPVVEGNVVMVRQYRAAIDQYLLELPAGKRDVAGEAPELTAARELEEEVGLRSDRIELLCEFFNTPGFCDEYSYCFVATDCQVVGSNRQGVEEEHMTIEHVALRDVVGLIADGTIVDGKSIIGLLAARHHLGLDRPND